MAHVHYFPCVLLVVMCGGGGGGDVVVFNMLSFIFFSIKVTLRMLQSAVSSDQRIVIYWPKSYLLIFIIIVKAGVVPTKTN